MLRRLDWMCGLGLWLSVYNKYLSWLAMVYNGCQAGMYYARQADTSNPPGFTALHHKYTRPHPPLISCPFSAHKLTTTATSPSFAGRQIKLFCLQMKCEPVSIVSIWLFCRRPEQLKRKQAVFASSGIALQIWPAGAIYTFHWIGYSLV